MEITYCKQEDRLYYEVQREKKRRNDLWKNVMFSRLVLFSFDITSISIPLRASSDGEGLTRASLTVCKNGGVESIQSVLHSGHPNLLEHVLLRSLHRQHAIELEVVFQLGVVHIVRAKRVRQPHDYICRILLLFDLKVTRGLL